MIDYTYFPKMNLVAFSSGLVITASRGGDDDETPPEHVYHSLAIAREVLGDDALGKAETLPKGLTRDVRRNVTRAHSDVWEGGLWGVLTWTVCMYGRREDMINSLIKTHAPSCVQVDRSMSQFGEITLGFPSSKNALAPVVTVRLDDFEVSVTSGLAVAGKNWRDILRTYARVNEFVLETEVAYAKFAQSYR